MSLSKIAKIGLSIPVTSQFLQWASNDMRLARQHKKTNALPYNIIPAGHSHPKVHSYRYSWGVREDKGTFAEFASSSEVLCNWHPIGLLKPRVLAMKECRPYQPAPL